MTLTVLRDMNDTLKTLFLSHIRDLEGDDAVIFDSPGNIIDDQPVDPILSVFLYFINPNTFLRNAEPEPVNLDQLRYPPVTLDLHYIFTPYAKDRAKELIIMENVIQTLHDNAVLRGDILQGNLAENGNDTIRITPQSLSIDELNKLWSVFPNKAYKLSLSYMATPIRIMSGKISGITRVVEKETIYQKMNK